MIGLWLLWSALYWQGDLIRNTLTFHTWKAFHYFKFQQNWNAQGSATATLGETEPGPASGRTLPLNVAHCECKVLEARLSEMSFPFLKLVYAFSIDNYLGLTQWGICLIHRAREHHYESQCVRNERLKKRRLEPQRLLPKWTSGAKAVSVWMWQVFILKLDEIKGNAR